MVWFKSAAVPPNKQEVINNLVWKIGGEAGMGIMVTGQLFAKICARIGLNTIGYSEYPSLIRGGHNTYHVRVCDKPIYSQVSPSNLLVALNKESILMHKDELTTGGGLIFDSTNLTIDTSDLGRSDIILFPVPLKKLAVDTGGDVQVINTVAVGATFALVDLDLEIVTNTLADFFRSKGEKVIAVNQKAASLGFNFVKTNFTSSFPWKLRKIETPRPKIVATGNEATALGAVKAGCKFYAAYPMTPTSNILHFLAAHAQEADMIVVHGEDEIGVVNMAVGASFAGVRSMVATSGGGFSLMVETLGLAGMTETPLVIILGQRPGPATGLPTWTAQADLRFALSAAQDDFPRIVMAPGDITECFYHIANAFNIAERLQTPVIFLLDKHLAESHFSADLFEPNLITIDRGKLLTEDDLAKLAPYKRYQFTEDGISPRALPGMKGGQFVANSDEHDEFGYSTEDAVIRRKMMEKRMSKLDQLAAIIPPPNLYGPADADLTLISWGSNKGVGLEVVNWALNDGFKVNLLHLVFLNPFPIKAVETVLAKAKKTLIIENNFIGHLELLIKEKTGRAIDYHYRKYDGRPFYPEEVYQKVKEIISR